jgi:hypothetical protein
LYTPGCGEYGQKKVGGGGGGGGGQKLARRWCELPDK